MDNDLCKLFSLFAILLSLLLKADGLSPDLDNIFQSSRQSSDVPDLPHIDNDGSTEGMKCQKPCIRRHLHHILYPHPNKTNTSMWLEPDIVLILIIFLLEMMLTSMLHNAFVCQRENFHAMPTNWISIVIGTLSAPNSALFVLGRPTAAPIAYFFFLEAVSRSSGRGLAWAILCTVG